MEEVPEKKVKKEEQSALRPRTLANVFDDNTILTTESLYRGACPLDCELTLPSVLPAAVSAGPAVSSSSCTTLPSQRPRT